jgi:spore coat polysaccharide biosynthesis protein SpsF
MRIDRARIGIVVQARMGSKRLPGKALAEIGGKPLLMRLCKTMRFCRAADEVVVATSDQHGDDAIAEACAEWEVSVFRGPAKDLATRLLGAAKANRLDAFVRVTGDNPLTDPDGVAELIEAFRSIQRTRIDEPLVVHNMHRKGYPYGTGAEVLSLSLVELCDRMLQSEEDREGFVQFAKQHARRFHCERLDAPPHLLRPRYFLTVDYPEDLELQRAIYSHFPDRDWPILQEVVEFLDETPELATMNSHLHQQFPE